MNYRKMCFFDIDGTLITEDKRQILPESAVTAIRQAREHGNLMFINTGRTFFNVMPQIRDIGFDGYVCGCGTYIFYDGKPILEQHLSTEHCKEIVTILRKTQVPAMLEGTERLYFDYDTKLPQSPIISVMQKRYGVARKNLLWSWDNPDIVFDKLVVWQQNAGDFKTFYDYIIRSFDYIDRGNGFGEIVPKGFSKASGIRFLQDYFQIPLQDCYAIGDSTNDLSMLEYVPHGIAMGNSMPELFSRVSFVTKDILEDGVAYALNHFHF